MIEFLLAIAVFLAVHALPARTGLRARGISKLGRPAYIVIYSLLSLGLTIWIYSAYLRAPYSELWARAVWQHWVPVLVMPFALVVFSVGAAIANPLSISFRKAPAAGNAPAMVRLIRHPVLWGFGLWAASHIPPNGDVVSLILFGGLSAFAFAGMKVFDRRKQKQLGQDRWRLLAEGDETWEAAKPVAKLNAAFDKTVVIAGVTGLAVYGLLVAGGHQYLFGVDPLSAIM